MIMYSGVGTFDFFLDRIGGPAEKIGSDRWTLQKNWIGSVESPKKIGSDQIGVKSCFEYTFNTDLIRSDQIGVKSVLKTTFYTDLIRSYFFWGLYRSDPIFLESPPIRSNFFGGSTDPIQKKIECADP